jgi:hypothetical protein
MLRDQAIKPLEFGPNPLGVALMFAGSDIDPGDLRRTLRARREMLAIRAEQIRADCDQLVAKGYLDVLAETNMRRAIMHAETEIRWHDEFDAVLAEVGEEIPPARQQLPSDSR